MIFHMTQRATRKEEEEEETCGASDLPTKRQRGDKSSEEDSALQRSSSSSDTNVTPRATDNAIYFETHGAAVIPSRSDWQEEEIHHLIQSMRVLSERIRTDSSYQAMNDKTKYLIVLPKIIAEAGGAIRLPPRRCLTQHERITSHHSPYHDKWRAIQLLLQNWRSWLAEHSTTIIPNGVPDDENLLTFLESRFKKESDRRLNRFIILTYYTHFPDDVTYIGALKQSTHGDTSCDIASQMRDMDAKAEQRHQDLLQLLTRHHKELLAALCDR